LSPCWSSWRDAPTPQRAPDPRPPVYIPESTWQQVDRDIVAASTAARRPAGNYARGSMKAWLASVRQRTEADFIPWYTGYWTQQWLAIKVAWYKMSAGQEEDPAVERLAAYLQEQYQEQVLGPVARRSIRMRCGGRRRSSTSSSSASKSRESSGATVSRSISSTGG
jgi:hypothetical protein